MIGKIKCLFIFTIILLCSNTTVFAEKWIIVDDRPTATYQIDADGIVFTGEESNRQLEFCIKTIEKTGSGAYMLSRYLVKENLDFILKERTDYSISGKPGHSFHNKQLDKWTVTTPASPVGLIATKIFTEYQKDPQSFIDKQMPNDGLVNSVVQAEPIIVNQAEVKQALDDNRIQSGKSKDGTKWFYVRDTWSTYHFLEKEHMTADFWLISGDNAKYRRFNFSFSDARVGSHMLRESVIIRVDDKEWVLSSKTASDHTQFPNAMFNYSFYIPDSLFQALLVTKGGITVKWKHSWGGWKDYDYTIPVKIVHDIQLMYAGCK